MNIAAVVLAAGGSTRLGSPKQLLAYGEKSLLRGAAESVLATPCTPVLVILGSGAEGLQDELDGLRTIIKVNPEWGKGMGTSVRLGVETLDALAPGLDGVLLTLCDQPSVESGALGRLLAAFERAASPTALVAAAYNGTVGVPAVFGRAYFDALCTLPDDTGAKPVLMKHRASVIQVPLPEAVTDIDTREQYERFIADNPSRRGN